MIDADGSPSSLLTKLSPRAKHTFSGAIVLGKKYSRPAERQICIFGMMNTATQETTHQLCTHHHKSSGSCLKHTKTSRSRQILSFWLWYPATDAGGFGGS